MCNYGTSRAPSAEHELPQLRVGRIPRNRFFERFTGPGKRGAGTGLNLGCGPLGYGLSEHGDPQHFGEVPGLSRWPRLGEVAKEHIFKALVTKLFVVWLRQSGGIAHEA